MAPKQQTKKPSYSVLWLLSRFYVGFGYLVGVLSVLGAIVVILSPSYVYDPFTGEFERGVSNIGLSIAVLVSGVLTAFSLVAIGQLIQLVIEIAENTRAQTDLLRYLAKQTARRNG